MVKGGHDRVSLILAVQVPFNVSWLQLEGKETAEM